MVGGASAVSWLASMLKLSGEGVVDEVEIVEL
jgi:hypothetical protein